VANVVGQFPKPILAGWIRAHVKAFSAIGGVPKAIVCHNLKAGVTKSLRKAAAKRQKLDDQPAN
jgi:transposase